jgi:hypothetical protein
MGIGHGGGFNGFGGNQGIIIILIIILLFFGFSNDSTSS